MGPRLERSIAERLYSKHTVSQPCVEHMAFIVMQIQ